MLSIMLNTREPVMAEVGKVLALMELVVSWRKQTVHNRLITKRLP